MDDISSIYSHMNKEGVFLTQSVYTIKLKFEKETFINLRMGESGHAAGCMVSGWELNYDGISIIAYEYKIVKKIKWYC